MITPSRKKEVIDICLETFLKKGLAHTPTRDLCTALNLNSGGVFYYFKTKDEIVVACAEEAAFRIEKSFADIILKNIEAPEKLFGELKGHSEKMRPLVKFFVSVSSSSKYEDSIQKTIERLTLHCNYYLERVADILKCKPEEVAPYAYIGIDSIMNYMLFGEKSLFAPQLELVYHALIDFLGKREENKTIAV